MYINIEVYIQTKYTPIEFQIALYKTFTKWFIQTENGTLGNPPVLGHLNRMTKFHSKIIKQTVHEITSNGYYVLGKGTPPNLSIKSIFQSFN